MGPCAHRIPYRLRPAVIAELTGSMVTIQSSAPQCWDSPSFWAPSRRYWTGPRRPSCLAKRRSAFKPCRRRSTMSMKLSGAICWLWVLANATVALFMIHRKRSKGTFKALVQEWEGILVSDGYRVYTSWVGQRQTCLAYLIRDAWTLTESKNTDLAKFGKNAKKVLQKLCHMAQPRPSIDDWRAFYARTSECSPDITAKKTRPGNFPPDCCRKSILSDSSWRRQKFLRLTTTRSGCCALPSAGAREVSVPSATKGTLGGTDYVRNADLPVPGQENLPGPS